LEETKKFKEAISLLQAYDKDLLIDGKINVVDPGQEEIPFIFG